MNLNGAVTMTKSAMAATTGIRVNGSTDNNVVSLTLSGITAAGVTDTITLGNGNADTVIYGAASLGTHNVTFGAGTANVYTESATVAGVATVNLGTGSSTVTFGPASITGSANITVNAVAHGGVNRVNVGSAGTAFATTPNVF